MEERILGVDYGNCRVVYSDTATSTQLVIGQTDATTNTCATSRTGLNHPSSAAITSSQIIVVDADNNRVLIYNGTPAADNPPASIVLGQNDFNHATRNDDDQNGTDDGAPTARTLNHPRGVWSDGTRLIVADSGNNRVLIWNSMPTGNFQPADIVLGQSDFASNSAAASPTASSLNYPISAFVLNGQLFVADYSTTGC